MPIPQWEDSFTDPTDEFAGLFMQPTQEMIPDDFQQQFSSSDPKLTFGTYGPGVLAKPIIGFGPGDYSGGYTGEGDSIYWGAFGGAADPPPSSVSATTLLPPSQTTTVAADSSVSATTLLPPSQTTSVPATIEMQPLTPTQRSAITTPDVSLSGRNTATSLGTDAPSTRGTSVTTADGTATTDLSEWQWKPYVDPYGSGPYGTPEDSFAGEEKASEAGAGTESGADTYYSEDFQGEYQTGFADSSVGTLPPLPDPSAVDDPSFADPSFVDSAPPNNITPFETAGRPSIASAALDDLAGLPDVPEMSFGDLDFSGLDQGTRAAFSDFIGDPSNFSLGQAGAGLGMGGMLSWFRQRGIDAATGVILAPVFQWLDEATGSPWVSRAIQGGMATLGWALGGDPFGVIVAPIAWGIQEWMRQRRRLIDNDDPEAVQGKKFGYVREGDKWFPAFVTSRERDEGWIGSNKTQMRLEYGNELRWKQQKGTGNWVPYFEDGSYRLKDFHVWDSYLDTDNEAGYDYMMKTDPLRDFYLLSDEDTDKLLRGFAGGDVIQAGKHSYTAEEQAAFHEAQSAAYDSFKPYDDEGWESYWKSQPQWEKSQMLTADRRRSEHNPAEYIGWSGYIEHLNDLRKSLDFMQDYRYSDAGQLQTSNHGENEFAGSRKLSRILMSQSGGEMGDANELERSAMYFQSNSQQVGLDRFQDRPELQYLAEMYTQAIDDLYGAQKRAGKSMKFDALYQPSATADRRLGPAFKDRGYMFYQDNAWEFGAIDTADQLKDALRKIEESSDAEYAGTEHFRNADQRSYLAQKAYARYLHSKINQLGGSDYMHPRAVSWQGEKGKPEILDPFAKARLDETTDKSHYYLPYPYRGNWNLEKSYGYDPLFSEIDDRDDEYQSYGSELVHRDGYDPLDTTEAGKKYTTSLVESSGVFDGAPDPDVVAGRYPDQQAFDDWMDRDEAPSMFYDESKKDFVYSGEQGDNTYWDEDSQSYRIDTSVEPEPEPEPDDGWYQAVEYSKAHGGDPQDYMGPDGAFAGPAAAGPPPFGYRKDGKVRKHPKRDVKPLQPVVGDWSAAAAVGDWSAAAPDSLLPVPGEDYPLGAGWRYDEESDMVIAPNNTTWFLDETEQMFHFAEQLEESHVKQAADAEAYGDEEPEPEPEPPKQVVPDEVPGASAPHQVMYHEQHHQAMHYAPDATAPVHIKVI